MISYAFASYATYELGATLFVMALQQRYAHLPKVNVITIIEKKSIDLRSSRYANPSR